MKSNKVLELFITTRLKLSWEKMYKNQPGGERAFINQLNTLNQLLGLKLKFENVI